MGKKLRRAEASWNEKLERWQINVQHEGERKTFVCSTPGRKGKHECEAKADKWLESNAAEDLRFQAAWDQYLENVKATTQSANHTKIKDTGKNYVLPHLGHKRLSKVTPGDMQECINAVARKGLSKRSCINTRACLVQFYRFCRKKRWPLEEPFDLTIPKNAPVGERCILQPNDLVCLFTCDTFTHYSRKYEAFFVHAWRLIVLLGLRRGELCGLRKEDLEGNILHIQRSINKEGIETRGKNDNARRYIALPQKALKILDDQQAMQKAHGIISPWLFPDEQGDRLDSNHLYKKWSTYAKQHGIHSSLHELRHTMISIMKSDMPEPLLKATVGHSETMDTYGVYGHQVEGDLQRAAQIIDSVYDRILDPAKSTR